MKKTTDIKTRTRQMYATAKRRAGGEVSYTLEDLRERLDKKLQMWPLCRFCNVALHAGNVSLDHTDPLSRGGAHDLNNVLFICAACNKAKGDMSAAEFSRLLTALDDIGRACRNPAFRNKVVGALRAANSFRIGANRRAKKSAP